MYQTWTKYNTVDLEGKRVRILIDSGSWFIGTAKWSEDKLSLKNLEDTNSEKYKSCIGTAVHMELPRDADIEVIEEEDPNELYTQFLPEDTEDKKKKFIAELQELRSKSVLSLKEKNLIAEAIYLIEGK